MAKPIRNSTNCGVGMCGGLTVLVFMYIFLRYMSHGYHDERAEVDAALIMQEFGKETDFVDIKNVDSALLGGIQRVYVIPGGGPGDSEEFGYPEWTRRRTMAAFKHYATHRSSKDDALFIALSAGSLNSANMVHSDGRTVFESQHVMQHLVELGVPKHIIFGDIFSWDTVTNGLSLRMHLEGLLPVHEQYHGAGNNSKGARARSLDSSNKINVEVYISDFHAARVKASFEWVLNLHPTMLNRVRIHNNVVDSIGIKWASQEDYKARLAHEQAGVEMIKANSKVITSMQDFYRFLMFGGHKGIRNCLLDAYEKSHGVGW